MADEVSLKIRAAIETSGEERLANTQKALEDIEKLDEKTEFSLIGKPFIKGKISDKEIVLCICGIGKVNSAMATQLIINEFAPTAILNFGTAGGFSEQVSPLKYYAIDKCFQADFDLSELDGVPVGYMQDYDRLFYQVDTNGLDFLDKKSLATADRFSDKTARSYAR